MEQFKGSKGKFKTIGGVTEGTAQCLPNVPIYCNGIKIAMVYGNTVEECEGNANLFQASRDLLEAIHELLIHAVENDLHSEFTNNAEIAIKKALK